MLEDFKRSGDLPDMRHAINFIAATLPEGRDWSGPEFESLREKYLEYVAQAEDIQERIRMASIRRVRTPRGGRTVSAYRPNS